MGVSMPELPKDNCDDFSVIVGEQLGAKVGDTVLVNDHKAKVAKTVDVKPGLDRVVVAGSLEQMSQCVFPEQPITGAVVLGADGKMAELQADLRKEMGAGTYSVRSFKEFEEKYKDFWDHSVKPPEMNLILDLSIAGAIGLAALQINEVYRRKKMLAMYLSQGVDQKTLSWGHALGVQYDNVLAAVGSVVPATALTAVTNSSQFGLEAAVTPNVIGAGYATVTAITALSSLFASRTIKKLDVASELRGDI